MPRASGKRSQNYIDKILHDQGASPQDIDEKDREELKRQFEDLPD